MDAIDRIFTPRLDPGAIRDAMAEHIVDSRERGLSADDAAAVALAKLDRSCSWLTEVNPALARAFLATGEALLSEARGLADRCIAMLDRVADERGDADDSDPWD